MLAALPLSVSAGATLFTVSDLLPRIKLPSSSLALTVMVGVALGVLVSISAVGAGAVGVTALLLLYPRLPLATITGVDTNLNRENNDITTRAFQYTGVGEAPKDIGECKTYNCSRGAWRTQANLRLSYDIKLKGSARVTVIGEGFNLFNAKNPGFLLAQNQTSAAFMQPNAFAGDFQQGEQRVGQRDHVLRVHRIG